MMYSYKKRKIGGATVSSEAKGAIGMTIPNRGVGIKTVVSHKDSQTNSKSESQEKLKRRGLSMKMLTDLFAPRFSYKRLGYGNDHFRKGWQSWEMSQDRAGTAKMLYANQGNQFWGEFVALPMWNPGVIKTGVGTDIITPVQDIFTGTLSELMVKARDIRNESNSSYINPPQGNIDGSRLQDLTGATPPILKNLFGNNFVYEGGYQEHIFENANNQDCILEIWELVPREVMPGYTLINNNPDGNNAIEAVTVARSMLLDYKQNLPRGNAFTPGYTATAANSNQSTDNVTDPAVRITSQCTHVHTKWYVKKPVRRLLKPGDRHTHKMNLHGFEMDNTAFMQLNSMAVAFPAINPNYSTEIPYFIPKFTKVMCVRAVGTTAWEGNANFDTARAASIAAAQANTSYADEYLGGIKIGLGEVRLTHQCNEYHACRMMPEQYDTSTFIDDLRDRSNLILYDINPETNVLQIDASGTGGGNPAL